MKTFQEILDVVKPGMDCEFTNDNKKYVLTMFNSGAVQTVSHLLYDMGLNPCDWSPQEFQEISEKLNIINDY